MPTVCDPAPKLPAKAIVCQAPAPCDAVTLCGVAICLPSMARTNWALPLYASSDRCRVSVSAGPAVAAVVPPTLKLRVALLSIAAVVPLWVTPVQRDGIDV